MEKLKSEKKASKSVSFMKNVLMLVCSQIIIKILGLIYRLVIVNIKGFGDVGNGYYSTGYNFYTLLLTLSSIGLPGVISKLVSERIAKEDKDGAQRIFKVAMTFFVSIGAVMSIGLFFGAEFIANNVYKIPEVKYVLKVLAPAIMFVSASSIFRGYFSGQKNMQAASISQTLEQFLNCVLSITFVYMAIGKESYIMAAAGNISTTLSVIITFIYLTTYYKRYKIVPEENQKSEERKKSNLQILMMILAISIPITLGSIISVVNPVLDNITVGNAIKIAYKDLSGSEVSEKAVTLTGMLSKADTLINLPLAVNLAFSIALIPEISTSIAKKENEIARKRIVFSIFSSIIIIIPCAIGYIVLANPILKMLYPNASNGAGLLQILAVSMVFIAMTSTINGSLYGLGKMRIPVIGLAIGVCVKLVLNVILIQNPNINIYGAAIGSVVCQMIAFSISFYNLNRTINLKLEFKRHLLKPLTAGIVMGIIAYFVQFGMSKIAGTIISCGVSIIIGALVYGVMIICLRVLNKEDILMIPYGSKVYEILVKAKIYKEEEA